MDIKPDILRIEGIDPSVLSGMHIKNEILYQVEPSHQSHLMGKDNVKVYYNENMHLASSKTNAYVPEQVYVPAIQKSSKYQTPKIRGKSSYSSTKQNQLPQVTHPQQIFLNHSNTIVPQSSHTQPQILTSERAVLEPNTVQVITPNANYSHHQWTHEVPVVPQQITSSILEQSIPTDLLSGQTLTSEAIFIPETTNVITDGSPGEYGVISASSINVIPVMTPNGIVLVAANNTLSNATNNLTSSNASTCVLSEMPNVQVAASQHVSTPATSRNYTKQKSTKKAATQQQSNPQLVSHEIISSSTPNVMYTANGPVLVINESRLHTESATAPPKLETPEKLPEKGTVIEEPPKAVYQSRVYNDINENSTNYSRKDHSHSSRGSGPIPPFDAEIDLDAALKIFKIYK